MRFLYANRIAPDGTTRSAASRLGLYTVCLCSMIKRTPDLYELIDSFKPGVLFMGHRQTEIAPDGTPQNAAFHLGLFCLLRDIKKWNKKSKSLLMSLKMKVDSSK